MDLNQHCRLLLRHRHHQRLPLAGCRHLPHRDSGRQCSRGADCHHNGVPLLDGQEDVLKELPRQKS